MECLPFRLAEVSQKQNLVLGNQRLLLQSRETDIEKKNNSLSQAQNWMKLLILKFALEGQHNCIAKENKPLFSAFPEEFSTLSSSWHKQQKKYRRLLHTLLSRYLYSLSKGKTLDFP